MNVATIDRIVEPFAEPPYTYKDDPSPVTRALAWHVRHYTLSNGWTVSLLDRSAVMGVGFYETWAWRTVGEKRHRPARPQHHARRRDALAFLRAARRWDESS
jgi:hypothetical protein